MIRNDLGEERVCFRLHLSGHMSSIKEDSQGRKSGRNLEERPEIETVRRRAAFWFDPPRGFFAFLDIPGPPARDHTTHTELAPST